MSAIIYASPGLVYEGPYELTRFTADGYPHPMQFLLAGGSLIFALTLPCAAQAESPGQTIPHEDYALYDQVVGKMFLTSEIRLVVIERMTVPHIAPQQDGPLTAGLIQEYEVFDGRLPPELVRDFVAVNQAAARLEGRFQFGVRYRFVTGNSLEEPEVSFGHPVKSARIRPAQSVSVLDRLAFSRVGRTLRDDQALLYVEQNRPDGTGAGFFVWFRRQGREWSIVDTDVVWTIREEGDQEEGPPLAP